MYTFSHVVRRLGVFIAVLLLLSALVWWLDARAWAVRQQLAITQGTIQVGPQLASAQALMEKDVQKNKDEVTALQHFILEPDTINVFITRLQSEADRQGVQMQVSDIQNGGKKGPDNKPLAVSGPLTTVELHVVAQGSPNHLLRFFQAVEQAPFLVGVISWNLSNTVTESLAGTATVQSAPGSDIGASPTPTATPSIAPAQLELVVLLSVTNTPS